MNIILFFTAILFSLSLNELLYRLPNKFGVESRQKNVGVRWGSTSKPTTGGIVFYVTFLLSFAFLAYRDTSILTLSVDNIYLGLFLSLTLAFLLGLADDAFNTSPATKLAGQLGCGLIMVGFGQHIHFFDIPALDYTLTIFWVIALMNSLNMLDNMDAATGTVSLCIVTIATITAYYFIETPETLTLIFLMTAGSFIGFLFHNWKPSKIYMGDSGSMFVGLFLAFIGLHFFWNIHTENGTILNLSIRGLIPLMVFLVPLMDTTFVTVSRIARGVSPFQGDRNHITHNLVHVGVPENLVPVVLGALTLVSGGLALVAYKLIPHFTGLIFIAFLTYPIILISIFIYLFRIGSKVGKIKEIRALRQKKRMEQRAITEKLHG